MDNNNTTPQPIPPNQEVASFVNPEGSKSSSKMLTIIIAVVAVVLLIAGGGYYYLNMNKKSAEKPAASVNIQTADLTTELNSETAANSDIEGDFTAIDTDLQSL